MGGEDVLLALLQGEDNFALLTWICELLPFKETSALSENLVPLAESKGVLMSLIKHVCTYEINHTDNANNLFRGNNAFTKLLAAFSKRYGSQFLVNTLVEPVKSLCSKPPQVEVEDAKLQPNENGTDNARNLVRLCSSFLEAIFNSFPRCPIPFREICQHLKEEISKKFPEPAQQRRGAASFVFLRFFCPAIFLPHVNGVIQDPPSKEASRALIWVSKVLQVLANGSTLDVNKGSGIEIINTFLTDNHSKVNDFLDRLAEPISSHDDTPSSLSTPPTPLMTEIPETPDLAPAIGIASSTKISSKRSTSSSDDIRRGTFNKQFSSTSAFSHPRTSSEPIPSIERASQRKALLNLVISLRNSLQSFNKKQPEGGEAFLSLLRSLGNWVEQEENTQKEEESLFNKRRTKKRSGSRLLNILLKKDDSLDDSLSSTSSSSSSSTPSQSPSNAKLSEKEKVIAEKVEQWLGSSSSRIDVKKGNRKQIKNLSGSGKTEHLSLRTTPVTGSPVMAPKNPENTVRPMSMHCRPVDNRPRSRTRSLSDCGTHSSHSSHSQNCTLEDASPINDLTEDALL